jgi:Tol biopolymer transport system component
MCKRQPFSCLGSASQRTPKPMSRLKGAAASASRAVLVAVIAVVAITASVVPASAQLPEPIVYQKQPRTGAGNITLWRANADGTNERKVEGLTSNRFPNNDNSFTSPALSPAGDKIIFSDGGVDLYRANVDGSGQQKITNALYGENHTICSGDCLNVWLEGFDSPKWSPDGTKVVLTRQDTRGDRPEINGIWVMNPDGTGLTKLVSWAPYSSSGSPTWSPNGQRIAFVLNYELWSISATGGDLRQHTSDDGGDPDPAAYDVSWSPDGGTLTFTNGDIWALRLATGAIEQLTATSDGEYGHDWSPNGSSIMFTAGNNSEIRAMNPDGTNYRTIKTDSGAWLQGASFRSAVGSAPPPNPSAVQLLLDYVPELRYDQQETFRADSAATVTDNVVLDSRGRLVRRNSLRGSSGGLLATSYFKDKSADLTLGFLGSPRYANGVSSSDTDYLDEEGSDSEKAADAQRMHGSSTYANKIYGHVVSNPNGEIVLQYWLFYYYNSKSILGYGLHEGDWENVSVILGPDYVPRRAAYAQHTSGERCDWSHVQRTLTGRPVVYVAQDSHASYFSSGDHNVDAGAVFDNADGQGGSVAPAVSVLDSSVSWFGWPGSWGSTTGGFPNSASPHGPGHGANTDTYNDPLTASNAYGDCTEEQTFAAAARSRPVHKRARASLVRPPAPKVRVKRHGDKVAIRYRFTRWPKGRNRRPVHLLTTVDPAGNKYPPLTIRADIKKRKGRVVRPLGAGHAPFTVLVSAEAASGAVSRTVEKPLR